MTTQWKYRATRQPVEFPGARLAKLDGGGAMFAPATTTFEFDTIPAIVDLTVDVIDGRPAVESYTVRRKPDGPPLEFLAREVVRNVSLRTLLREAALGAVLESTAGDGKFRYVTSTATFDALTKGIKSRRLPMSDERLRLTADAYRDGGVDAVMLLEGWQCERRQAQRAVKLARERGFLKEDDQ